MPTPVYGFLQGDTIGLLMFVEDNQTLQSVARHLAHSARLRAAPPPDARLRVVYRGQLLDDQATVASAGFEPLSRVDVVYWTP